MLGPTKLAIAGLGKLIMYKRMEMSIDRMIVTAADADSIREDIESVYDGWFAGTDRIDWENFMDRLEKRGYDLGDSWTSPAMSRIQKIVKRLRTQ